jgi:hypothetical protein
MSECLNDESGVAAMGTATKEWRRGVEVHEGWGELGSWAIRSGKVEDDR